MKEITLEPTEAEVKLFDKGQEIKLLKDDEKHNPIMETIDSYFIQVFKNLVSYNEDTQEDLYSLTLGNDIGSLFESFQKFIKLCEAKDPKKYKDLFHKYLLSQFPVEIGLWDSWVFKQIKGETKECCQSCLFSLISQLQENQYIWCYSKQRKYWLKTNHAYQMVKVKYRCMFFEGIGQ